MGGSGSRLPRDLLGEYQELTFLSKQEILLAHRRFCALLPREARGRALETRIARSSLLALPELRANPFRDRICRVFSTAEDGGGGLSFEDFLDLLSVFSDAATAEVKSHYAFRLFGSGSFSLDPWLCKCYQCGTTSTIPNQRACSLTPECSGAELVLLKSLYRSLKRASSFGNHSYHSFSPVFSLDFDDDGTLDKEDLEKLVNSLTGEGEDSRLSSLEMDQLIQNILEESDIDKDGTINLSEFQHIISRSPDFTSSFKIVL